MTRSGNAPQLVRLAWLTAASLAVLACRRAHEPSPPPEPSSAVPVSEAREAEPEVVKLWPEGVPGLLADAPPERIEGGRIYNVAVPTLTLFPAKQASKPAAAAIVAPGGAYVRLAVTKEGSDMTRWLNSLGVTAFVLKYRVAPYRHPAPLRDVLRAVRWVRSNAEKLGVDPHRIAVFGSSAGGHVAASAGALFDSAEGKTGSPLDGVSARPDLLVLLYPVITMRDPSAHSNSRTNLLGEQPSQALVDGTSLELHVKKDTPATFLVHTAEDRSVPIENSLLFYQALRAAGVSAELHAYEKGPHGFGLHKALGPVSAWPARCEEWLRFRGFL